MSALDFYIMSADTVVGEWKNTILTLVNTSLAPMYLVNTGNVSRWLETRAIDSHRANSRLLKKVLRLTQKDDESTVISVYAATITDNYWIKPFDSNLTYKDVQFNDDNFAGLALRGNYDSFVRGANSKKTHTPELTNTGSFEKCWKIKNGEWWMVKSADQKQQFSEVFIYELGKHIGFHMAEYVRGTKSVMTRDFTDNGRYNFEPAYSFMGDNEDYAAVVKGLRERVPEVIPDYIRLIFMDTIIANPDRHTFNFGLLRDSQTGTILSLAPNFDNNMALIARGYPKNIQRQNDILIQCFNELMAAEPLLKQYIPSLSGTDIWAVLKKVNMKVQTDTIVRFIMNGYEKIAGGK